MAMADQHGCQRGYRQFTDRFGAHDRVRGDPVRAPWVARAGAGDDCGQRQGGPGIRRGLQAAATLTGILRTIALSALWAIIIIESLQMAGLDIAPILGRRRHSGPRCRFLAQHLRDLMSGFFIILEDQIRLGDVAVINGTGGQVGDHYLQNDLIARFLRRGAHFPQRWITTLSNMTRDWSAFVLDMGVAYREETDRVVEVMRAVGEELRQDQEFSALILSRLRSSGSTILPIAP